MRINCELCTLQTNDLTWVEKLIIVGSNSFEEKRLDKDKWKPAGWLNVNGLLHTTFAVSGLDTLIKVISWSFLQPDWALVSGWRLPGAVLCKENDKWVVQCDSSWWIKLQLRLILHTFYWLGVGGVGWRHWPGSRTHTQPQTWAHLLTVKWLILSSSRPRSNSYPFGMLL